LSKNGKKIASIAQMLRRLLAVNRRFLTAAFLSHWGYSNPLVTSEQHSGHLATYKYERFFVLKFVGIPLVGQQIQQLSLKVMVASVN